MLLPLVKFYSKKKYTSILTQKIQQRLNINFICRLKINNQENRATGCVYLRIDTTVTLNSNIGRKLGPFIWLGQIRKEYNSNECTWLNTMT